MPSLRLGVTANPLCRAQAEKAYLDGDVFLFMVSADNQLGVELVAANAAALKERGILEECVFYAMTIPRINYYHYYRELRRLLGQVDRAKLLAQGDPLPGSGPYRLYRGVAGRGPARRVRGFAWTFDREQAQWFADRYAYFLADPGVYVTTVGRDDVLFFDEGREKEMAILLASRGRTERVS